MLWLNGITLYFIVTLESHAGVDSIVRELPPSLLPARSDGKDTDITGRFGVTLDECLNQRVFLTIYFRDLHKNTTNLVR